MTHPQHYIDQLKLFYCQAIQANKPWNAQLFLDAIVIEEIKLLKKGILIKPTV